MQRSEIGSRLRKLRGNRSREEVAAALGLSVSALQMYENGYRIPRDEFKIRLSRYYGVSVQELFFPLEMNQSLAQPHARKDWSLAPEWDGDANGSVVDG